MESLLFWHPSLFLSSLHVSKPLGHFCCTCLRRSLKTLSYLEIFKFCTTLSLKPCFCRYDGLEVSPCLGVDVKHFLLTHLSGINTVFFCFFLSLNIRGLWKFFFAQGFFRMFIYFNSLKCLLFWSMECPIWIILFF